MMNLFFGVDSSSAGARAPLAVPASLEVDTSRRRFQCVFVK